MKLALIGILLGALAAPASAATEVRISVDSDPSARPRWILGLSTFFPENARRPTDTEFGRRARETVRADLLFSRYFDLIEKGPAADVRTPAKVRKAWKSRGAEFIVEADASQVRDEVTLNVSVRDLASGDALLSRFYRQKKGRWRSLAHRVSDDIVRQLTGKKGIAQSRIAFTGGSEGGKELYLIDYDGAQLRKLTKNGSINLLPRWSPDGHSLAFTSYRDGNPDLYLLDLMRGKIRRLSAQQGLNLAGGFSPDGTKIAATLSKGKNPNIYFVQVRDGSSRRTTRHRGVESSPTFSPDGEYIAFVSDRAGNPQIHKMEITTGRTKRLTRLNWCDSPSWSPTGEWIAFAGRAHRKDTFDIFLTDVTGTRVVQLTHGEGSNEDPSWSPDGRFLVFTSTRDKRRRLYVMDADGSSPHSLGEIPGAVFTPDWGS